MIERGGEVRIAMLADVKQRTIRPLIEETIAPGTLETLAEASGAQTPVPKALAV